jgi:hypothetical protein
MRRIPLLFRLTSAGMLVLILGACTPGGQFDPTVLLQSDMFDTKKKLQGDREPVFQVACRVRRPVCRQIW